MRDTDHRGKAIDFSTRSLFGEETPAHGNDELRETLRELQIAFPPTQMRIALSELGLMRTSGEKTDASESVLQALRAFCVLIIESCRPKLTAQLVGKLVKLEIATGRRIILRELGRANGISKQAISKQLSGLADRLNLPRPDSAPGARDSHRLMNKRNYGKTHNPAHSR